MYFLVKDLFPLRFIAAEKHEQKLMQDFLVFYSGKI